MALTPGEFLGWLDDAAAGGAIYDVVADGTGFLVAQRVDQGAREIRVVRNWLGGLPALVGR